MGYYRKKPIIIEAKKLNLGNFERVADWCNGKHAGIKLPREQQVILIQTLEGEMTASLNDWIIKGVKGEFYPCKPDIFEASYESATTPSI